MVIHHLFCMGNGYFSRRSSAESHCLCSDGYLSAETEKGINMDCCRLNSNVPRSCASVENGLTRYKLLLQVAGWLISVSLDDDNSLP